MAHYSGLRRTVLVESNEYGYESLIKATYQVLEKLNLENKTLTEITPKARKEQRIWKLSISSIVQHFLYNYLQPTSRKQQYFLTNKGRDFI
jgi:hypothetical protein